MSNVSFNSFLRTLSLKSTIILCFSLLFHFVGQKHLNQGSISLVSAIL